MHNKAHNAHTPLPREVLLLICQVSDRRTLNRLQHVSAEWRFVSLPLIWKTVEIGDWEYKVSAPLIHSTYGSMVRKIEYRRHQRRRGTSAGTSSPVFAPTVESKTKTEVACEWLSLPWGNLHCVEIGAWPPYNIGRVQAVLSESCKHIRTLVFEGAAAAWVDTLQRAVSAHPGLQGLHITEDSRALMPPVADVLYKRLQTHFGFMAQPNAAKLTRLTVPCVVESAGQLLGQLARLLPTLVSLDLRQVDASSANRLVISPPLGLKDLRISGRHPLSMRMFGAHSPDAQSNCSAVSQLAAGLKSLSVSGLRSEEAAQREFEQFWSVAFQHKWPSLSKLVVPVARPELGFLLSSSCLALRYLHILQAGSSINPQHNNQWAAAIVKLPELRHLDIASSNNEYEGCSLSSKLVTGFVWNAHWIHTLYLSRLILTADHIEHLARMLPYLCTVWFTFDTRPPAYMPGSSSAKLVHATARGKQHRLRYIVIQEIIDAESTEMRSNRYTASAFESEPGLGSNFGTSESTRALSGCLDRLPSINKCRLPMFTFPDDQRRWLQRHHPLVDFNKYAPPF
ncbi:hypothetical protein FB645_004914 [Coemansia sp. IMI 203386]|nr:hypothetical protein FB645_004914 [Coemansia sp. IMI 203386]